MKRFLITLLIPVALFCAPAVASTQTSAQTNTIESPDKLEQIYKNTEDIKSNTDPFLFNHDAIWLALASLTIAILTLVATCATLHFQKLSIRNVSGKVQNAALTDLIRHLYRNVDCTVAMVLRFRSKENSKDSAYVKYPSEANLLKLKAEPERYVPDAGKMETRKEFYELRTLLRNYSEEIEVASKHLSTMGLKREDFEADFDNLLFKPFYLTSRIYDLWKCLKINKNQSKEDFFKLAIQIIVEEHLKKVESFEKYQKNIAEHPDRAALLVAINDDNTFDLYTKKEGEEKNSVKRGMMFLLRLGEERTISISDFMAKWSKNGNAYNILTEIRDFETIDEMFEKLGITKEDKLRNVLAPYFEILRSNVVDVEMLLTYMIKIDAILEMPKIGMISYV